MKSGLTMIIRKGMIWIDRLEQGLTSFFLIFSCLLVFVSVLLRVTVGYSNSAIEEIVRYLVVWCVFLGASLTLKNDRHITVEIVISRLSGKVRNIVQTTAYLLGLGFCLILFLKGIEQVLQSITLDERSTSALRFPLFIPKLAVPVGAALLSIRFVEKIYFLVSSMGRGEDG